MTCIQKFQLFLLTTSNIFTWLLIYKKMPKLASGTTLKSQVSPFPSPSPLNPTPTLDKCPAVPMLYCILKQITCAHDLKEFLTQTSSQGYSHSICLTESKPLWICIAVVLVTVIISFEKCLNCLWPKRSPRGGGGYSYIKGTGLLVGKLGEHP